MNVGGELERGRCGHFILICHIDVHGLLKSPGLNTWSKQLENRRCFDKKPGLVSLTR